MGKCIVGGLLWRTSMGAVIVTLDFEVLLWFLSGHNQNKSSVSLSLGKGRRNTDVPQLLFGEPL